uniref:uncharacterized protein LOC109974812 isoform X2 n=1 Tax=Monopterus albus TaxID=43700 RepID=UPI0009B3B5B5|nr:uncharacterized protein LOC109974812 isoform X2 [Monopterus albus]
MDQIRTLGTPVLYGQGLGRPPLRPIENNARKRSGSTSDLSGDKTEGLKKKRRKHPSARDASVRGQTYKAPPKQPAPQDTITDESCLKLDPKTATTKTKVSSCFTPDRVLDERGETSYRFKCPSPGVYQCASTQLVFKLTQKAELSYKIIQWDKIKPPLPSYKRPDKRPAGPLYHIECSEKAVAQLCLPHCEAQPAPPNEDLCVAHFRHGRMGILKPLKITDTHVVVNVPHLSALGLIWKWVKKFLNKKRIIGQVLLFHHPKFTEQLRKLNIFLLPANVPLREVKQEQENAEYIENPAFCVLTEGQTYTVRCSEAHEIHYSVHLRPQAQLPSQLILHPVNKAHFL